MKKMGRACWMNALGTSEVSETRLSVLPLKEDTGRQRRHGTDRVTSKRHSFCVFFYGRKKTTTTSNFWNVFYGPLLC